MKTNYLLIVAVVLLATISKNVMWGASFPKEDPTTPILITQLPGIAEGAPRSHSTVSIEADFDWGMSVIDVWIRNAGTSVIVDIQNITTGNNYYYVVSGEGWDSLPINSTSGNWRITFILSNGSCYVGYFMI